MSSDQGAHLSALGPFRALDLTDEKGLFCGRIFASLGAEVIKVERPGGDAARNIPPFIGETPGPENSLYYLAYNSGKKSVTLDIETADGQAIFKKLVASSDFVFESFMPGYMESLGLDYRTLSQINPRIVVTSITPFGQTGSYRYYKASDLVCTAMSGFLYLTGDTDRAPVRVSVPQAFVFGAAEAAAATMVAHYERERSGQGQHVDEAIRDAMIMTTINAVPWWEHDRKIMTRGGPYWGLRGHPVRVLWPCRDGWVSFALHGSKFGARTNRQLVEWADGEGLADDLLKSVDWENLDMENVDQSIVSKLEETVARFFLSHTREEITAEGLRRGILVSPVETIEDISSNPQLAARGYWEQVEIGGQAILFPGAFVQASSTPCVPPTRAPSVGEHNEQIYVDRLGLSRQDLVLLRAAKVI